MEEVTDEPLYRDRVCGIDIGKAAMVATIRVPSDNNPARRAQETRSFGTTKKEVLALADWLRSWQVPAVVMEATDVIRGSNKFLPHFRRSRPKCRHEHRLKQDPRFTVEQPTPGTFRWTAPSGRTFTTEPTRYPI